MKYKYKDKMRWLWMLSVIYPTVSMPGIYLHHQTENGLFLFYPFIVTYLITKLLDLIVDEKNEKKKRVLKEKFNQNWTIIFKTDC